MQKDLDSFNVSDDPWWHEFRGRLLIGSGICVERGLSVRPGTKPSSAALAKGLHKKIDPGGTAPPSIFCWHGQISAVASHFSRAA